VVCVIVLGLNGTGATKGGEREADLDRMDCDALDQAPLFLPNQSHPLLAMCTLGGGGAPVWPAQVHGSYRRGERKSA
jgi:hypothetical protein